MKVMHMLKLIQPLRTDTIIQLHDGRTLSYATYGRADGKLYSTFMVSLSRGAMFRLSERNWAFIWSELTVLNGTPYIQQSPLPGLAR
jgi:hypothetical protein